MNLQTIQKRIEELSSQLITVSNDLAFLLQGEVVRQPTQVTLAVPEPDTDWAKDIRKGDTVVCVGFNTSNSTRRRCFTVGKEYIVDRHLHGAPGAVNYGLRIVKDDEGESHDATGVLFSKAV